MKRPTLHLICNAHLDPVWQWQWEEGCAEALSTFQNAVELLDEHDSLIFNHNEAVLYRWVQRFDPALFKKIIRLVKLGRWCISGGWYLQPDANIPGTESFMRQIAEGRDFFRRYFGAVPRVAYNFDSFGHSGGLPQILRRAGYRMYIHMRPQAPDLALPSDLYRWRGVDGSEILTYRIAVGLYHTERDNIGERLSEGTELALKLGRDVPVFWGIGNHGGGATREDLAVIDRFIREEKRVRVLHSTPEVLYRSLKTYAREAPVVEGDLQRIFTGCYTSLSRVKRGALQSLAQLVQTEAFCAAAWWSGHQNYSTEELRTAWLDHLFNDFHDILPGSCTEPAEQDALALYGRASQGLRELRFAAAASFNEGHYRKLYIPIAVLNSNPACTYAPIEAECMLDLRPKWSGRWHLRLYDLDGSEIACQEEQPECLLPFNGWRRKLSFFATLPSVGMNRYEVRFVEGEREPETCRPMLNHAIDPQSGLLRSLKTDRGFECLAGPLLQPIVVNDEGDSWGADVWSYRDIVGRFESRTSTPLVLHDGPIRRITETVLTCGRSSIIVKTHFYAGWPVIEYRLRIQWNEERKRLKLSIPTTLKSGSILCEIPGGAITRPNDGQEHVQGRWCLMSGISATNDIGFGVVNSGQHGFDFKDGELRLSVLRSAAYCHERGFALGETPSRKYMDQGIHEIRLLMTIGGRAEVLNRLPGLADYLAAPPAVFSHFPVGSTSAAAFDLFSLAPSTVRLLACKQSRDKHALIVRLQEAAGIATTTYLTALRGTKKVHLSFSPFEIKTLRFGKKGNCNAVDMIVEK
jgi:alpha-mannosidase